MDAAKLAYPIVQSFRLELEKEKVTASAKLEAVIEDYLNVILLFI